MRKIYIILPVLAGIMFGSSGIFVRTLTYNNINPTTLLFLRFSIAITIMLIAILITDKKLLKINLNDIPLFLVTSLSIVGLNLFYNESMNTVSLSLAAVLLSSAPVFVILFAYFLINEKITFKKVFCIVLVIIGCILTTGLLESNVKSVSIIGVVGGIIAAFFWAIYTVASRKSLKKGKHTYTILFYSLILITIVLIPFTNFNEITVFINSNICQNILFLVFHSTISFALPYIFITASLKYLESGIASIFTSGAEPLAALVYGIVFYNEIPSILMFAGIILTIISLIILTLSPSKKKELINNKKGTVH